MAQGDNSSPGVDFPCRLFIYGTLLLPAHFPIAGYLAEVSRHLGAARLRGYLYDLGAYPGAVPQPGAQEWIQGVLMEIDEPQVLERLDQYEGEEYRREWLSVETDAGDLLKAWVYCYNQPVEGLQRIESGDYASFFQQRQGL
jgi:gamma-glutamylcyclotransferase (GGCT)/AIG2-like uncharacterized protein YtfP